LSPLGKLTEDNVVSKAKSRLEGTVTVKPYLTGVQAGVTVTEMLSSFVV